MSIWAQHKRKWYYKEWLHRNKQSDVCNFIYALTWTIQSLTLCTLMRNKKWIRIHFSEIVLLFRTSCVWEFEQNKYYEHCSSYMLYNMSSNYVRTHTSLHAPLSNKSLWYKTVKQWNKCGITSSVITLFFTRMKCVSQHEEKKESENKSLFYKKTAIIANCVTYVKVNQMICGL